MKGSAGFGDIGSTAEPERDSSSGFPGVHASMSQFSLALRASTSSSVGS